MASTYYIKLFHEILDDRKMGKLPDRAYRHCMSLFLYAGELGQDGILPPTEDIAWRLRRDEDDIAEDLELLASVGIVESYGEGWLVCNFAERQKPMTANERQQRKRDKKPAPAIEQTIQVAKSGGNTGGNTNDLLNSHESLQPSVTIRDTEEKRREEIRRDLEENRENTTPPAHEDDPDPIPEQPKPEPEKAQMIECVEILASRGLFLDSFTSQLVSECFEDVQPPPGETKADWFRYACAESAGKQVSWKYLEAIIRGVGNSGSLSAHKANRLTQKEKENGRQNKTSGNTSKRETISTPSRGSRSPYEATGKTVSRAGLPLPPISGLSN